jgi:hypothetical protein
MHLSLSLNTTKNDIPTYFWTIFDPTIRVGPVFFIAPLYVEINVSKNHATSLLSDGLRVKNENDLYVEGNGLTIFIVLKITKAE